MTTVDHQLTMDTLARFEKQIASSTNRSQRIELCCLQAIPFLQSAPMLQPLLKKWRNQYAELSRQNVLYEAQALEEVTTTFRQIKAAVGKRKGATGKKIQNIEEILAGRPGALGFVSKPLYEVVYWEIKELLEMLLTAGKLELCKQYAVLQERQKYLVRLGQEPELVKEPYIQMFTFAPSVAQACSSDAMLHWGRRQDPAVMWYYFELAAWFWGLPEDYFEKTSDLLGRPDFDPLPALNVKSAWLEIAEIKNRRAMKERPIIFTEELFSEGFRTVANEIYAFMAKGCQIEEQDGAPSGVTFGLYLDENCLWVFVSLGLGGRSEYCLKRFNDGGAEGSVPYNFVKKLLHEHSQGGDVEMGLMPKSQSIPKMIDRCGIPREIKSFFFGKSRGSRVCFKGARVTLEWQKDWRLIIKKLEKQHQKLGGPQLGS